MEGTGCSVTRLAPFSLSFQKEIWVSLRMEAGVGLYTSYQHEQHHKSIQSLQRLGWLSRDWHPPPWTCTKPTSASQLEMDQLEGEQDQKWMGISCVCLQRVKKNMTHQGVAGHSHVEAKLV